MKFLTTDYRLNIKAVNHKPMAEKRTWVEIDLDAVAQNVRIINNMLDGKSKLMAIVKADAYGHGAVYTARAIADCGVGFFGVSCIDEAIQLREGGIAQDILILGHTNASEENVCKLSKYNITQTIFNLEQTEMLSKIAGGRVIKAHIKIDTGMNRLGLSWTSRNRDAQTMNIIKKMKSLQNIDCDGIFTHFAVSDDLKSGFTTEQLNLFQELVRLLKHENIYFKLKHAANSAAVINFKETHLDYARCGLILYGLYPAKNMRDIGLVPAMQLKTVISHVHTVKQGETVSYGRTYKAGRDIKAATLPIGYADGFSRLLSNSASVLVQGRQAPVIGRVCMDYCMIDATDCPDVQAGDIATIFGRDEITGAYIGVEQLADMAETINYEFVCLIGKRVPRIYYKNGREIGRLNYIAPE